MESIQKFSVFFKYFGYLFYQATRNTTETNGRVIKSKLNSKTTQ